VPAEIAAFFFFFSFFFFSRAAVLGFDHDRFRCRRSSQSFAGAAGRDCGRPIRRALRHPARARLLVVCGGIGARGGRLSRFDSYRRWVRLSAYPQPLSIPHRRQSFGALLRWRPGIALRSSCAWPRCCPKASDRGPILPQLDRQPHRHDQQGVLPVNRPQSSPSRWGMRRKVWTPTSGTPCRRSRRCEHCISASCSPSVDDWLPRIGSDGKVHVWFSGFLAPMRWPAAGTHRRFAAPQFHIAR